MATSNELRPDGLDEPLPDRFNSTMAGYHQAMAAHRQAVERDQPGYLDPRSGLFVMTATALAARGGCCGCGCRHCPYPAD